MERFDNKCFQCGRKGKQTSLIPGKSYCCRKCSVWWINPDKKTIQNMENKQCTCIHCQNSGDYAENVKSWHTPQHQKWAKFWAVVHNLIAHPLLITNSRWADRFHDWTAQKM